MKTLFSLAAIIATIMGCAVTNPQQNSQAQEEKDYVTGSNIPRRNRSDTEVKSVDPQSVRDAINRTNPSSVRGN
jgi:hypothetical protein